MLTWSVVLLVLVLTLQVIQLWRSRSVNLERGLREMEGQLQGVLSGQGRIEHGLREEFARSQAAASQEGRESRSELNERLERSTGALRETLDRRLSSLSEAERAGAEKLQQEVQGGLKMLSEALLGGISSISESQQKSFDGFRLSLGELTRRNQERLDAVRETVDQGMTRLQESNTSKLEEMRRTVDEKLQGTLEKRLGESFCQVSQRLEQVHRGLGEMQSLASGVGDLKRLMTNVKARGTWGEMQLGNLLEQILAPDQYQANVETRAGSGARVEFAVRLPGQNGGGEPVWLPIDAKFPQEDYQRLLDAHDQADAEAVAAAGKGLERALRAAAKDIGTRYLGPPATTDFAILFVPVEGLYAELLRRPGLVDALQREYRVAVAGPTTLAALLNSLQMGFRTLAIQKRSSEVWEVLGAVKTEFEKFAGVLDKVQKKLREANNVMEKAKTRTRVMERRLRSVEQLPAQESERLLGLEGEDDPAQDLVLSSSAEAS